jgi:flagellar hook-associated protein 1 FlgK
VGGASFNDIVTSLNTAAAGYATFALDGSGNLTMTPASAGASLEVKNDTTARGATGVSLSQFFGMGSAARQNQAASLAIRSDIASNSSKMALAQLDLTSTTVAGDTVLGISDNRGALALAGIANTSMTWPATGGLSSGAMSIGDYVAQIMGAQSDLKNAADAEMAFRSDVSEEVNARRTSVEGVNLDEELSNMMVFQQAYNASARLMTTVQQMFDTLLDVV